MDSLALFSQKLKNFVSFLSDKFHVDAHSLLAYDPVWIASTFYNSPEIFEFAQKKDMKGLLDFVRKLHPGGTSGSQLPLQVPPVTPEVEEKFWLYFEFFQEMSQILCAP